MSTWYNVIALAVFYFGLYLWMNCESDYVQATALICSIFAFEYLLGFFNEVG